MALSPLLDERKRRIEFDCQTLSGALEAEDFEAARSAIISLGHEMTSLRRDIDGEMQKRRQQSQ